jgi:ankyrin repeat protein
MHGRCTPFMKTPLKNIFGLKKESLFDAISNQDLAKFKELLENGYNPNELDNYGQPPIFIIVYNKQIDFLKLLISFKPIIDFKKDDGTTALFYSKGEIAELLLKNGASLNIQSNMGSFPIHYCTDVDTAKLFIAHGADINAKDFSQSLPLHKYVYFGSNLVNYAIKNGAQISVKDIHGRTPLINLSFTTGFDKEDNIQIVRTAEILVNAGAVTHLKDNYGKTAVDYALDTSVNNYALADYLISVIE